MSYLALYRKYRPADFNSVYGQEEVVTVIKNAIFSNKISHAYLFCGPRGTGKTTIAKIIAKLVNCEHLENGEPCGKCYNCVNFMNSNDIVEIDAASNNGVDEIREIRDKINLVPSNAKYKVYIIDEVHMLTTQAFNALLKTLEEPPAHVIFILATTEPHKIPLTIASRCQKFRFSKINDSLIADRLREIAGFENIEIDNDALFEIARLADGGMRDAINILDQLVAYSNSKITLDDIYKVNGSVSYSDLYELLKAIIDNDKVKIIEFVDNIDKNGKEIGKFVEEMIIFLKDVVLYKNANYLSSIEMKNDNIKLVSEIYSGRNLYDLIECLNNAQNVIKFSTHGSIVFLTSILKFSDMNYGKEVEIISREINEPQKVILKEKSTSKSDFEAVDKVEEKKENISQEIISKKESNYSEEEVEFRINNALALASKDVLKEIKNKWNVIDEYIYEDDYSMAAGILKDCNVVVASSEYVIIENKYDSGADRINENAVDIEKLFENAFNMEVFVVGISSSEWENRRNKYISDIKNGIKYTVKERKKEENTKIEKTPVDELIDLVGDSLIEYK